MAGTGSPVSLHEVASVDDVIAALADQSYLADEGLATAVFKTVNSKLWADRMRLDDCR